MRDINILHQMILNNCPQIHQKRLQSLMLATETLLNDNQLSLTELGRNMNTPAMAKHNIKRMDRLLGNTALHNERIHLYRFHARLACGANPMPILLIDWADVREQLRLMTLRASISIKGRSMIIYERTFSFEQYNSPKSHQLFLDELAQVLPEHCIPLIVTDAGYRNTWFRQVDNKGWFWLGRIRGNVSYQHGESDEWLKNKALYSNATQKARYIGEVKLGRKSPISCNLHLFKSKHKGRKDKRSSKAGRHHTAQKSYRVSSKEPWLLATNLPLKHFKPNQVVALYSKRMQIEETFRDLKSPQYGMGLRHSKSRSTNRLDILLLISLLATLILWWIGLYAKHAGWARSFQANTIRTRAVLSTVRLGKEVRRRKNYRLSEQQLKWAINDYIRLVHQYGKPE